MTSHTFGTYKLEIGRMIVTEKNSYTIVIGPNDKYVWVDKYGNMFHFVDAKFISDTIGPYLYQNNIRTKDTPYSKL